MMLERLKHVMKRLNQVILVFPVWIVLGISGILRRSEREKGWQKSEKHGSYEKMY